MAEVTRDSIKAFKGKPLVPVEVPEWGGTVYLRIMSGAERDAFEDETYRINGKVAELNRKNFRARLLVRCLCNSSGSPLYSPADAAELGQQPADILDRLATMASEINGMSAKDVESLAKNSDAAPSGGNG
jgi:hypothetical protein